MDRPRSLSIEEAERFLAYLRGQAEYHAEEARALKADQRWQEAADYKYESKVWDQAAREFERLLETGTVPAKLVSRRSR